MPSTPPLYRLAARLGSGLAPALSPLSPKLAAGHRGRRDAGRRLAAWAARSQRPARARWSGSTPPRSARAFRRRACCCELRRLHPEAQYVYTHYSPSAEPLARRLPVDARGLPPLRPPRRRRRAARRARARRLLVFSKLDLWPELATRAAARGAEVAIVAATVSPGSGRLRWPARIAARARAIARSAAAAAVSEDDAARLAGSASSRERIQRPGRSRASTAWSQRISGIGRGRAAAPLRPRRARRWWRAPPGRATRRCCSTPSPGCTRRRPDARLILVPHEPTQPHLAAVEDAARAAAACRRRCG